jgi:hypothetical protein
LTYGTGRSLLAITERGEGSSGNGAYDGLLSGALADWQLLAGCSLSRSGPTVDLGGERLNCRSPLWASARNLSKRPQAVFELMEQLGSALGERNAKKA